MPHERIEDAPTSDVGIRAWGATLAECFAAAAEATVEMMIDNRAAIEPRTTLAIDVAAEELELTLLRFLEELLFHKDARSLLLRCDQVSVEPSADGWRARARARGETIDPGRHNLALDVKAVTLHRLAVRQTAAGWEATVVLDV